MAIGFRGGPGSVEVYDVRERDRRGSDDLATYELDLVTFLRIARWKTAGSAGQPARSHRLRRPARAQARHRRHGGRSAYQASMPRRPISSSFSWTERRRSGNSSHESGGTSSGCFHRACASISSVRRQVPWPMILACARQVRERAASGPLPRRSSVANSPHPPARTALGFAEEAPAVPGVAVSAILIFTDRSAAPEAAYPPLPRRRRRR